MISTTEQDSLYPELSELSVGDILTAINNEDQKVALAVQAVLPSIENFIKALVDKMEKGGRLFYIGAGTSGRLGIVDASECPPTFGVPFGLVNGIIAGGDMAIRKAVEFAEDNTQQAWLDLQMHKINADDVVLGLSASGTTPYVLGGLKTCRTNRILTASICCNSQTVISANADYPIEVIVGPEIVTGSTRMKAGTAQKMVLNMITTTTMIRLGRVQGSKMVDMQLSNDKLIDRGTRMVMEQTHQTYEDAKALLLKSGNVRKAIEAFKP
ncbi:MAG: N-acetylmuramic acid 6-phosphate etherase [bacterium]|nr:N-acetylmuramic acid 6-phosphate etherase [bacterium]